MKTYKIHLIRHGLTEANEKGQYIGASDIDITTDGIIELETLRTTYAYPDVRLFYVCEVPLENTKQIPSYPKIQGYA